MVTICDVARAASVAPSTVSHFLNGTAPVSEATAARIRQAIQALNYRPNMTARSLRLRRANAIGLLVPNIANPFFAEIARSIEHVAQRLGYQVFLCDCDEDPRREFSLLENLLARPVDGVLIISTQQPPPYLDRLSEAGVPVVFVDRGVDGRPSVTSDNFLGGVVAARHLLELGHRRIGLVVGSGHLANVTERVSGFMQELARNGVRIPDNWVLEGPQTMEAGRAVELLMNEPKPPTAVFATNDIIAVGALYRLAQLGIRVPADVSVLGYDNIEITEFTIPPLSTVAQEKRLLGRKAVLALMRAMRTGVPGPINVRIPPRLIVRSSTARPGAN